MTDIVENGRSSFLALMLPVILLGGIYSGYFSPTESAAVALAYVIAIEAFIYRDLTPKLMFTNIVEAGKLIGALFPLVAATIAINLILVEHRVPQTVIEWVLQNIESKLVFTLAMNGILFLMGCFMDTVSAILITSSILPPMAQEMGFDRIHLGVVMILNLEIGFLTPPFGLNLIVAMVAFRESFGTVVKAALPFVGLMVLCLALVIWQPWIAMALVD